MSNNGKTRKETTMARGQNVENMQSVLETAAREVGVTESAATNIAKHLEEKGYDLVKGTPKPKVEAEADTKNQLRVQPQPTSTKGNDVPKVTPPKV